MRVTLEEAVREWVARKVKELGPTKVGVRMGHTGRSQLSEYFTGGRNMDVRYLSRYAESMNVEFRSILNEIEDAAEALRRGQPPTLLEGKRKRLAGASAAQAAGSGPVPTVERPGGLPSPRKRLRKDPDPKKPR